MKVRDAVTPGHQHRVIREFEQPPDLLPGWRVLGVELVIPGSPIEREPSRNQAKA
ncbi:MULTISPECIES: hypothetical protein [Mycolicibacterium]|uniref:hypothetical protein n=1 Tax=Mycolicibacterium TaxID=1866885 RepID=UPI001427B3B3|nr:MULTISPECIES: hypothetical protein [Mycolicibacterium]MCV7337533.1 hypothetical protein [Mycolicibacterium senegalense]MDR7289026.1 hypothetical protein [Mycolicibacterium senegalense]QZA25908.1 hypothetical protein K3U95_07560 [Mycolicibacterium senegalense]